MMFYVAKTLQACAMAVILIDFVRHFPNLMSHNILLIAVGLFAAGWIVEKFLLKS